MLKKWIKFSLIISILVLWITPNCWSGNKKIMSTRAAKVLAERSIVESVYGLKLRASETVENMVAATFIGVTESKTAALIKGIQIEEITYDEKTDVAKAIASIKLDTITNIDGQPIDLKGKIFRRVAFATSTPSQSGPLKALRAAELDAYKQLIKRVVGFNLESETTVENYMLKSDLVKTKVLATLYLAEPVNFGWDKEGNAFVKMALNIQDAAAVIGEKIVEKDAVIEVEGMGAQTDDFIKENKKSQ